MCSVHQSLAPLLSCQHNFPPHDRGFGILYFSYHLEYCHHWELVGVVVALLRVKILWYECFQHKYLSSCGGDGWAGRTQEGHLLLVRVAQAASVPVCLRPFSHTDNRHLSRCGLCTFLTWRSCSVMLCISNFWIVYLWYTQSPCDASLTLGHVLSRVSSQTLQGQGSTKSIFLLLNN